MIRKSIISTEPTNIRDKGYYKNEYSEFWNTCIKQAEKRLLEAGKDLGDGFDNSDTRFYAAKYFEQYATTEQAVGYYLTFYPQDPFRAWQQDDLFDDEEKNNSVGDILSEMAPIRRLSF